MLTREDLAAIGAMMDEKLETVKADFAELMDEKLEPIQKQITGIEERFTGIEERVTRIEERVTGIEERVAGLEERVTGIEERVTGIEERLAATEKETRELKVLMENETNRAVNLVLEGHEGLRQMIEEHLVTKEEREQDRIRIHTLEGIARLHTEQITDLKKKIS